MSERKKKWPPTVFHHRQSDQDYIKITVAGRRRTVYLGRHDSPQARAKLAQVLVSLANGEPMGESERPAEPDVPQTVDDLIARFWAHAHDHYRHPDGSPTSEIAAYAYTLRPLRTLFGPTLVASFGPKALRLVRQRMVDEGLSRRVVNQRINRIRHIFKWAASHELVPQEVYQSLRTVEGLSPGRTQARDYPEVEEVADAVVDATLPHLNPALRAMVQLQRFTGMRPGEVCILRPCDIDRGQFKVDGVEVWVYRPKRHKNAWRGQKKAVAIGPRAQEALAPFLNRGPEDYCFSPREALAIASTRRKFLPHYTINTYGKRIRLVCDRHGIPRWHPHQLRHNYAGLTDEHFDLETASAAIGDTPEVTRKVYARRRLTKAARAAAKLG